MGALVLIVEDDPDLRGIVEFNVRAAGHRALAVDRGQDALDAVARERPDIVLLDLMLPDMPGTEVCRALRANPSLAGVPVLMLTARGDEIDRVVGFEVGADDFMVKPFSVRELLLRILALLRRATPAPPPEAAQEAALTFGPVRVILASQRAFVDDDELALTSIEFTLLRTLIERRGRVQSRQRLLADVWQVSPDIESRTVDTHIRRLRQKLGAAGALIETVRGTGYRLAEHGVLQPPREAVTAAPRP